MEHRAKIFHSLVIRGKLRSSVRWITNRDKCGVLQPGDIFPKTCKNGLEDLHSKRPGALPPTVSRFEAYGGKPPEFVPVDITNKTVDSVTQ